MNTITILQVLLAVIVAVLCAVACSLWRVKRHEDGILRPVRYRDIPYEEIMNDKEFRKIYHGLYEWKETACEHEY